MTEKLETTRRVKGLKVLKLQNDGEIQNFKDDPSIRCV